MKCISALSVGAMIVLGSLPAHAIMLDQVDDFESGTTAGWAEGGASPNKPVNIANGGLLGAGDNYLENVSATSGPGGAMVMFNLAQWTGDYNTAGVGLIEADMANLGANPLFMRLAIEHDDPVPTKYGSTNAVMLPADGVWRHVSFSLNSSAMTVLGAQSNPPSLAQVLDDVKLLRILSAENEPAFSGDVIAGTLGADNIHALPEPSTVATFVVAIMCLARRRRDRVHIS